MIQTEILQDSEAWLNDNNVCPTLIKKQYPNITGLDPTILQEVGSFKPFPPGSKSLQILHTDGNHWIAASNIGCTTTGDINIQCTLPYQPVLDSYCLS